MKPEEKPPSVGLRILGAVFGAITGAISLAVLCLLVAAFGGSPGGSAHIILIIGGTFGAVSGFAFPRAMFDGLCVFLPGGGDT